ncbi:hypothetical protein L596_008148 [Steinernema carpocapsae]|uniref:Uncharacterized protein n=1 Tax=Steinernema carpocapsae TaxID=34508 RepID=A0A4U5PBV1_STECR|nr:hypothetical protein L596_008148 [Steinernema carpocapsae]
MLNNSSCAFDKSQQWIRSSNEIVVTKTRHSSLFPWLDLFYYTRINVLRVKFLESSRIWGPTLTIAKT